MTTEAVLLAGLAPDRELQGQLDILARAAVVVRAQRRHGPGAIARGIEALWRGHGIRPSDVLVLDPCSACPLPDGATRSHPAVASATLTALLRERAEGVLPAIPETSSCIELARRTGLPLRMAAKVYDPEEHEGFADVVEPAIREGVVTFLGELGPPERDALYAGALATLMLGAWPEPFGLVAIESMATGTPVIARRAGALTETIEHHVTGYLVDDLTEAELAVRHVADLRRDLVRERVIERFLPSRMVDEYEAVYRRLVDEPQRQISRAWPAALGPALVPPMASAS